MWLELMWLVLLWLDLTCLYLRWHWTDMTWTDVTWRYETWLDVTWTDLMWLDLLWLDLMCLVLKWLDLMWHDLMWLDLKWLDLMPWCNLSWCDLTWCDLTWMIWLLSDLVFVYVFSSVVPGVPLTPGDVVDRPPLPSVVLEDDLLAPRQRWCSPCLSLSTLMASLLLVRVDVLIARRHPRGWLPYSSSELMFFLFVVVYDHVDDLLFPIAFEADDLLVRPRIVWPVIRRTLTCSKFNKETLILNDLTRTAMFCLQIND